MNVFFINDPLNSLYMHNLFNALQKYSCAYIKDSSECFVDEIFLVLEINQKAM